MKFTDYHAKYFAHELIVAASAPIPNANLIVKLLKLANEHGLLGWCFRYSGKTMNPFAAFKSNYPQIAAKIARSI